MDLNILDVKSVRVYGLTLAALCTVLCFSLSDGLTSSACYGVYRECDFYDLTCPVNEMIKLGELYAGRKTQEICNGPSHCSQKDVCCSSAADDALETFTLKNVYDTYNNCSGKQECLTVQAPWQLLSTKLTSTFVEINYDCIDVNRPLQFCSTGQSIASYVELMFDGSRATYNTSLGEIDCRCRISQSSQQYVKMTTIDVRMHRSSRNVNQTQECSSSTFRSPSLVQVCVDDPQNHHKSNFKNDIVVFLSVSPTSDIVLENVYKGDNSQDAPAMVWVAFEVDSGIFTMDCKAVPVGSIPSSTTTTTTTSTTTTPTTTTTTTPTTTTTTTPSTTTRTTTITTTTRTTPFRATTTPTTTTTTRSATTTPSTTTTTTPTTTTTRRTIPTTMLTSPTTRTTSTTSPTTQTTSITSTTSSTTPTSTTTSTTARPISTVFTSTPRAPSSTPTRASSSTSTTTSSTTTPTTRRATTPRPRTTAIPPLPNQTPEPSEVFGDGVADDVQKRAVILAIAIPVVVFVILVILFIIWIFWTKTRSYKPHKTLHNEYVMQDSSPNTHHVYFAKIDDMNL